MSKQDRATTERNARTLRELVKQPDNKLCADCKRNGQGVFLCIRCSGIHRGMGTHISKVKSVDLDTWTPEQMEKWGNRLANLYWEAHLKPGHIPPEHKMESFIRSKYESKRWALEGPPPSNPADLENTPLARASAPQPQQQVQQQPQQSRNAAASLIGNPASTTRQPQTHRLLSATYGQGANPPQATTATAPSPAPATAPAQPQAPANDLFSLDFHAPSSVAAPTATASPEAPKKDVKQDILSLFSSPQPSFTPAASNFGQFAPAATAPSWPTQTPQPQPQATSMLGTSGVGAWGVSSGWGAPVATVPAQPNIWGSPPAAPVVPQQAGLYNSSTVWQSPAAPPAQDSFGLFVDSGTTGAGSMQPKKDDAFGDLWGGFK
ncbi:hypothetical protein H0H92_000663 [Tricholoma furcatifolium]|nr:hypothetical protein H0H92_000663 [Tricholoma furcatifolium]